MINGVKSAAVSSTYANVVKNDTKDVAKSSNEPKNSTSQTKAEAIKEKIASGEYKLNFEEVAKKMAEELLS